MPNRVLKESIKYSDQIDSLTWFEEVVFYRLMVSADDYGCYDGRINVLKNELFPAKDNVTRKSVEDAISHLASVGLLCQYTVSGKPYLLFPSWEKHQRVRNKRRKFPEPPENLTADRCQMTAGRLPESNPIRIQSESESEKGFCAEPGCTGSAPPAVLLPLNNGTEYPVTEEELAEFGSLYPAVDVAQELRSMRGWLLANPNKRKTRGGIRRFVNGWLAREQDRGGARGPSRGGTGPGGNRRPGGESLDLAAFEQSIDGKGLTGGAGSE